jgi:DNA-binding IclR family transcriptional regulator
LGEPAQQGGFDVADNEIQVLGKAIELMSALAADRPLSAAELSEGLAQPRSTVYRILGTLVERGWVEEASRGKYRVGAQLLATGRSALDQSAIRKEAIPVMKYLSQKFGQTIFLFVASGDRAVCLETIEGTAYDSTWLRPGGWLRYEDGASPRVLLANNSAGARRSWENRVATDRLSGSQTEHLMAFKQRLATIKNRGYEIYNGSDRGYNADTSIAAPIFDRAGRCVASISVGGRKDAITEFSEQAYLRSVVASAAESVRVRSASQG